ncbi:MAG TPA: hypothetical protein VJH03_23015 [Blastocatellia bacterium]|nr:hypothetical protein [Blastocatellia bacterium]
MIATLRGEWDPPMAFPQVIALCDRLDGMLQAIRSTRRILPPMMRCSECGYEMTLSQSRSTGLRTPFPPLFIT